MDWLQQKEDLLAQLRAYITRCSRIEPPPDFIAGLQRIKPFIETANEDELPQFITWWETIKPKEA